LRKISISSDHAGFKLKESIKKLLIKKKFLVLDLGPRDDRSVDYPDYAKKLAKNIISKKSDTGILVCGSGTGMAMSANRFKKIRAAVCYNAQSTKLSRSHNNANIIAIGSRLINKNLAFKLVMIFLKTKFDGGRHKRRTNKI
jgi:ribose 5-phosphate isomerase B